METDAEQLLDEEPIGYELTSRAIAILEPDLECSACDGHPAKDHADGGACTWQGVDAEGFWQCDCRGSATDDDPAA